MGINRREILTVAGVSLGFGALSRAQSVDTQTNPAGEDALDAALSLIHKQEPRAKQGLSTHAPMVAEALSAMGHADRAVTWFDAYRAPMLDLPRPSAPIDRDQWRAALGPNLATSNWESANSRWADWVEFFAAEMDRRPWRDVLDLWAGRLAPGMSGGATHGVIRTAHAVRAIGRRESQVRRAELARALGYWASSYEEMPGANAVRPAPDFTAALADVPLYWNAFERAPEGRNIVEQLRHLGELKNFEHARSLTPEVHDLGAAISALTATFARVYLRHGSEHHTIAFVHAVTGPCALRRIAPYVKPATARAAFGYAWQAAAGIYAAYARNYNQRPIEETKRTSGELIAAALKSGDEHAIKFTEVMVAESAIQADPVYLAAAENAVSRLTR